MATESILVRHGQTVWNAQGVLQARAAVRYVADHWTPTAIYYSPTSKIAQCSLGPVFHRTPLLNARHKDGHGPPTQSGLTPARAEMPRCTRVHFHACVVCASEHDVYFEDSRLRSPLMSAVVQEDL